MEGRGPAVIEGAIAGILISAISLLCGLLSGPSLGMSVGATAGDQLGRSLQHRLLGSRRAVTVTAVVLTLKALVLEMRGRPVLGLAGLSGYAAWRQKQRQDLLAKQPDDVVATLKPQTEEIETTLLLDVLSIEVGHRLFPSVDSEIGETLVDRISLLRRKVASELVIVIPPVHVRDNVQLEPNAYRVLLLGNEIAAAKPRAGRLLALDPSGTALPVRGEDARDPAHARPARRVSSRDRELAETLEYTDVDHAALIATHLAETARPNAHRIIGRTEVQDLFDVVSRGNPRLFEELVSNLLSYAEVLKLVRNLLKDSVSIRDVRSIAEGVIGSAPTTRDPAQLTERGRQRLSGHLTSTFRGTDGQLWALCALSSSAVIPRSVSSRFEKSGQTSPSSLLLPEVH